VSRLRNGINRTALACAGIALTAAGTALGAVDHFGRDRLPTWWPTLAPDTAWVDRDTLVRWRDQGWSTSVVVTVLGAAVLLCLAWCALQVRSERVRLLPLGHDGITLSGDALSGAIAQRTQSVPGVAQARVRLLGKPHRLRARVYVVLAADAAPAAVLQHFSTHTLAETREVVFPRHVAAEVRFQTRRGRPRRIR
jgi:hypothetical protein